MTVFESIRMRNVIRQVAKQNRIPTAQCRSEMKAAILEAWSTSDPQVKQLQIQLIGEDRVPSPEEFVYCIVNKFR